MSLILKQEPANTIATPPAGKSTLFVNDNSVMSVKSPDGNVTQFPTVQGSNTQVFFNDNGAINGNANLTFDKTTSTMSVVNLSVTGNLNAGDINVSSIANGTSNVDIIGASGNVTTSVGGNANVLVVTATGANVTGTFSVSGNANVGNIGGAAGVFTTVAGSLTTASQPNVTSLGTLTTLSVSGNAAVGNITSAGLIGATGNVNGGNLTTGGQVVASGNVIGSYFIGNGSQLTGIDATAIQNGNSNVQVTANSIITASVAGNANVFAILGTGIQANGTVSASGNVTAGNIGTGGLISATGNVTGGNVVTAGSVFAPAIVANSGAYATQMALSTSTGIIEANTNGNGTQFLPGGTMRLPSAGASDIVGGTFDGSIMQLTNDNAQLKQIRGGNVLLQVGTGGTVASTLAFNNDGSLTAPGLVSATGNVTGGNLITGGLITSTGNITGGNVTTAGLVSATGNVTGGNLTTGGLVNATGNIVSSANVVTDLIVGKTSSVSITATGTNQNINLTPTGTGTVNVGNFIISNVQTPVNDYDAATKKYVDDVSQGLNIHDAVAAATPTTLATITSGTITYNNGANGVGANLTTTGSFNLIDGVNVQTSGTRILVKSEANAVYNGIYTWSNATVITRATDFNSVPEVEAGDFVFVNGGTLYDNTGWVQTDSPAGIGGASDTITFTQFSGAGTYTAGTGLTLSGSQFSITNTTVSAGAYGNGDYNATFTVNGQGQLTAAANVAITANAANLSGTVLKSTIVTSSLTSVGTLTSLSISGNANVGNIGGGAGVFTSVTGSLTTAAQPNITSVGTLASLSVSGNANVGNLGTAGLIVATGNITGGNLVTAGALSVTGNANIGNVGAGAGIYTTLSASGNVTGGNLVSTGTIGATGATHLGNTFTTGANTTTATVTGNFALSAGSRFAATYS